MISANTYQAIYFSGNETFLQIIYSSSDELYHSRASLGESVDKNPIKRSKDFYLMETQAS